jgi:heme-degrading monooxygenase HmoA
MYIKEAAMQAKIIIKRKFIKGKQREIIALLRELRSGALQQPGYISGETLTSAEDPQTLVVIGSWQDMESWINWRENDTRKTLERMLETYQETSSEYQELTLGTFIEE